MKLLIIAGPYEADRIRKAAVSAGIETVAVEPGESLSGWITASRPDVIIMAPQMVSADPLVALDKVQAVPRGRVPIFLVGEAADADRLRPLADGFFVRPVAAADLLEKARQALEQAGAAIPVADVLSADGSGRPDHGLDGPSAPRAGGRPPPALRPLVADHDRRALPFGLAPGAAAGGSAGSGSGPQLRQQLAHLAESIDADLDREMRDVARAVGALRPGSAPAATVAGSGALEAALPAERPTAGGEGRGAPGEGEITDQAAIHRARVRARHALALDGDYFQILELHRQAQAAEIEAAYRRLSAELAPEALHPQVGAEMSTELALVHRVLDEARRFLGDDRLRQLYREHLPEPPAHAAGDRRAEAGRA